MNKHVNSILQKRMDRKDFLKHVGLGFVVLTGLAGVIKVLKPQDDRLSKRVAGAYGSAAYGGRGQVAKS